MVILYIIIIALISIIATLVIRKSFTGTRQEYLITVFVLLVVGCLMTLIVCRSCTQSIKPFIIASTFFSAMWIALWIGNSAFSDWISMKISWMDYPVKMLFILMSFTIAYTLISVYLILWFYRQVLGFNVQASGVIYSSLVITFLISMFMHGRSFLLSWKQSAIDAEKLKHESVTARYESLKNQVNPHFLFNSLTALSNLVHQDADKAEKFIKQLSDVYRYVLDTRDKELVPISEELKFLNAYAYLQQIRFGEKLQIKIDLDDGEGMVAPLALQMLIENAVKHNVISEEFPLHIRIFREDSRWIVENSLQVKNMPLDDASGVGLENIKKRYEFLSDSPVLVEKSDTQFRVSIPIIPS